MCSRKWFFMISSRKFSLCYVINYSQWLPPSISDQTWPPHPPHTDSIVCFALGLTAHDMHSVWCRHDGMSRHAHGNVFMKERLHVGCKNSKLVGRDGFTIIFWKFARIKIWSTKYVFSLKLISAADVLLTEISLMSLSACVIFWS